MTRPCRARRRLRSAGLGIFGFGFAQVGASEVRWLASL
uniref:Uncharacterized protein n=1 Tax=Arundo donax TaxID=35708 RepID=A0A0A9C5J5_ARUDO